MGKVAFDQNEVIKHTWSVMRAIFFLPLSALEPFIAYLRDYCAPQLGQELGVKYLSFIDKYLYPNYFDPVKAKFY